MAEQPQPWAQQVRVLVGEKDTDVLVFCGRISTQCDQQVQDAVSGRRRRKNVALILTTRGGDPDAAYKIARCLQRSYERFTLLVDWHCKSAGTLLAIGAHEIVMTDQAELGPLDTQIQKSDELGEMTSGLTALHAFRTLRTASIEAFVHALVDVRHESDRQISTRTAADVAAQMVVGLFSPIYGRVDPMLLGEHSRAMMIAETYGKRLGRKTLHQKGLERLVASYPSHSYVIDREEAKEIFTNIRVPSATEQELLRVLHPIVTGIVNNSSGRPVVEYLDEEQAPAQAMQVQDAPAPAPATATGIPAPESDGPVGGKPGVDSRPTSAGSPKRARGGRESAKPEKSVEGTREAD